ncbi:apses-domain-containing protein [Fomitiporia mediterranea MF3/22]|uniref:apses-domain-containing protein n=1 Tax=Fomitiporia mediterranea (strain MF3/22) TaxID=694068 RepID=UPI00044092B5|nr:apses-domain-containing protein [Fomitiporia mediterranea MF3/22]EJD00823.1 apses-domain-containing protein [Fomitiporia mediterranea MF3/22]
MPDNQIFKATYSGVPVYEMMCKGVAVMRRKSDGWLNATQILKVAGFDKPQRTRVLERDIQKGEHEKVQGGYGKYQGTWIPPERGLELARLYNCDLLLRPIIEFQPDSRSPPPAPKHIVAPAPGRQTGRKETPSSTRTAARRKPKSTHEDEGISLLGSEDDSDSPSPSEASTTSPTPPPIRATPDQRGYADGYTQYSSSPRDHAKRRDRYDGESGSDEEMNPGPNYVDEILEYFISESSQIPQFLITPPKDFDPNIAIDDEGHTALHWASAMGRMRVVKLLLTAGADIFKVNKAGQTALMRSVMFSNNYDVRKFPELYELLHRSTLNIDNYNRTVFHHIMDVAMSKGKTHAARYYMETILQRLAEYPKELADIINFQDEDGETALTMAARCRSKRLVKLLIDHGADPKIANRDGKCAEDYILEDERFRSSPTLPSRTANMSFRTLQAAHPSVSGGSSYANGPALHDRLPLHHSVTAQIASTRCVNDMAAMLESLAASFDQELKDKEHDMAQAQLVLHTIQSEILDHQRSVMQLKHQCQSLDEAKAALVQVKHELLAKMNRRYRLGWEKWHRDEEDRERAVRSSPLGQGLPSVTGTNPDIVSESMEATQPVPISFQVTENEDISDLRELYSNLPNDEKGVQQACQELRADLVQSRTRRSEMFEQLATLQAEAGTQGRMAQYRRLLSAGCGGMPQAELDDALAMLLDSLEAEDPGNATTTWSNKPGRPGGGT